MALHIRFAGPDDAPVIHRFIVALATYEREPEAVQVTPAELRAQIGATPPPFECLLAEQDGEARGFALFFATYSTWTGRQGMYLEDLFVDPEHRGEGIGRRLLAELAAIAVERGYARFEWSVLDWNEPAIGFYQALGARLMKNWIVCRLSGEPLAALARRR